MERKKIYSIEYISKFIPELPVENIKTERIMVDGDMVFVDSLRLLIFKRDNWTCSHCGLVGTFFAKEKNTYDKHYHLNLYAVVDGKEVLMTKDHHFPKSKGGENSLDNLFTMCEKCNKDKADMVPFENEKVGSNMIFVDFEATEKTNEILSIGAMDETGEKKFYTLAKPKKLSSITPRISELTGLTPEMFEDAPSLQVAFTSFYEWVLNTFVEGKDNHICIYGNNDRIFVKSVLKYFPKLKDKVDFILKKIINFDKFACIITHNTFQATSLFKSYQVFYDDVNKQSHNALDDANLLRLVFAKCQEQSEEKIVECYAEAIVSSLKKNYESTKKSVAKDVENFFLSLSSEAYENLTFSELASNVRCERYFSQCNNLFKILGKINSRNAWEIIVEKTGTIKKKCFIICSKDNYCKIPEIEAGITERGFDIIYPNSYNNPYCENDMRDSENYVKWKSSLLRESVTSVEKSDVVLVLNLTTSKGENYIGGATFLEMYEAFRQHKKIGTWNPLPNNSFHDELVGLDTICINGNLDILLK